MLDINASKGERTYELSPISSSTNNIYIYSFLSFLTREGGLSAAGEPDFWDFQICQNMAKNPQVTHPLLCFSQNSHEGGGESLGTLLILGYALTSVFFSSVS